jgi:hypothetical protein
LWTFCKQWEQKVTTVFGATKANSLKIKQERTAHCVEAKYFALIISEISLTSSKTIHTSRTAYIRKTTYTTISLMRLLFKTTRCVVVTRTVMNVDRTALIADSFVVGPVVNNLLRTAAVL